MKPRELLRQESLQRKQLTKPFATNREGTPLKAVVIDDVFSDRRIMSQILRSAGFDVTAEAPGGQEGLKAINETKPDLVILDYKMPGMSGLDVLKRLHQSHPDMPVIMSTGEKKRETVTLIIQAGAAEYIVKPFDREIVISKLKAAVSMLHQDPEDD